MIRFLGKMSRFMDTEVFCHPISRARCVHYNMNAIKKYLHHVHTLAMRGNSIMQLLYKSLQRDKICYLTKYVKDWG